MTRRRTESLLHFGALAMHYRASAWRTHRVTTSVLYFTRPLWETTTTTTSPTFHAREIIHADGFWRQIDVPQPQTTSPSSPSLEFYLGEPLLGVPSSLYVYRSNLCLFTLRLATPPSPPPPPFGLQHRQGSASFYPSPGILTNRPYR
jgi:hypothetical protein